MLKKQNVLRINDKQISTIYELDFANLTCVTFSLHKDIDSAFSGHKVQYYIFCYSWTKYFLLLKKILAL